MSISRFPVRPRPGYLDGLIPRDWPIAPTAAISIGSSDGSGAAFGAWNQVVAANAIATDFVIVGAIGQVSHSGVQYVVRFGMGASGAETVIGATPLYGLNYGGSGGHPQFWLPEPIRVPANSRVATSLWSNAGAVVNITNARLLYYPLA